jgi:hypothetical protein
VTRTLRSVPLAVLALVLALVAAPGAADDGPKTVLRSESFDKDPGWEGLNNRVVPEKLPVVTQDFGYSATNFAGKEKGELGGRITRAAKPAHYADKLAPKTLDDTLAASGTFALTATTPGAGFFFGWFSAEQPTGGGRPVNSLGLDFDCEHAGARLAVRMIGGTNKSCGTFITPFIPGKFRPTPIRNDGTRYTWTLNYDPVANAGGGRFEFTIKSTSPKPEEWEGKTFTVNLPEGFKKTGATFDRFGLANMTKPGGSATVYFDDLKYDGTAQDFAKDPEWVGSGNRAKYEETMPPGTHNFGFSEKTKFAGGAAGEVGGDLWRSGKYGYYADKVGALTLDDKLEASGRVVLKVGAPDSDMFIGWFDSGAKDKSPATAGHFLGVHVGGPTRVGHYFHPALVTGKGTRATADKGPVLTPNETYEWSLAYDPAANGGKGEVRVTLGKESVTLALRAGVKAEGARFDRFGLLTSNIGGQLVRVYFDDLKYTARAKP